MKQELVEIFPIVRYKKWYCCDIVDQKNVAPKYRYLKDIEEVRSVCWDRIAKILERNAHVIDYCDNNLC